MLTRREVKYTSASPRCTCLPPRQHCAGVALGSPLPTPQHCWFGRRSSTTRLRLVVLASSSSTMLWSCTRCPPQTPVQRWFGGRTSTPRLRLGVLAFLLINIALKLHSEESKYISAAPRCTCFPPCATSAQVHRGQVQVQLGFASLYLDLALVDLSGVGGGLPRATSISGRSGQVASLDLDLTWTTWARVGEVHLRYCATYINVSLHAG